MSTPAPLTTQEFREKLVKKIDAQELALKDAKRLLALFDNDPEAAEVVALSRHVVDF